VHSVAARVNGCKVVITATAPGSGGRGNPMCTEILESMGVVDFSAKAFGRRSPLAVVQATYKALKKHRGIDDMTRGRGLRLVPFDAAARRGV
jgi:ribosomal protein S5